MRVTYNKVSSILESIREQIVVVGVLREDVRASG